MTFITPLFAGIAAAIAVPTLLILYFLKLRQRDLEVSTTLLWKKAIEDLQANAPFQRLRRNLLLFLQLIVLGATLFALAQPQIKGNLGAGTRHLILIDRSASMQSTDADKNDKTQTKLTRLEEAKAEANALVDSMRDSGLFGQSGDEAMVIAFDSSAEVRQAFTQSKSALHAAIDSIEAVDSPSLIKDALRLARAQAPRRSFQDVQADGSTRNYDLPPGAVGTIHVFSDGRLSDISTDAVDLAAEDVVLYHAIGSADSWNVGIVGLRAQRAFDDLSKISIFVGLQSTARQSKDVDVQLAIDGQVASVKAVKLPAAAIKTAEPTPVPKVPTVNPETGEIAPDAPTEKKAPPVPQPETLVPAIGGIVFTLNRTEGGVAAITLTSKDIGPLPTDKIAYLVLPPAKRLSVALVTAGNFFLREALEGLNLTRLQIIPPGAAQAILDDPKQAGEYDVWVLDRWLPNVKDSAGKVSPGLPAGRFLVLGVVPPPPLGLIDKGAGDPTVIIDWKRNHPVLRSIGLDALIISPGRNTEVAADSPVTVLAQGQGGPAIVEVSTAATRALIVTFDLGASTWPFDPGFVLFTAASLSYLGDDSPVTGDTLHAGGTLSERLPSGATTPRVTLPDNTTSELSPTSDGQVVFGPIHKTGIYTLSWQGPAGGRDVTVNGRVRRAVAANLLDSAESDIATAEQLPLASKLVAADTENTQSIRRLWPWFLLGALAFILLEWYIYNRKVMV